VFGFSGLSGESSGDGKAPDATNESLKSCCTTLKRRFDGAIFTTGKITGLHPGGYFRMVCATSREKRP